MSVAGGAGNGNIGGGGSGESAEFNDSVEFEGIKGGGGGKDGERASVYFSVS
jgi:hypothetical protein